RSRPMTLPGARRWLAVAALLGAPARADLPDSPPPEAPARVQLSESTVSAYHLDNGSIAARGTATYDPTGSNYVDWLNKLQLDAEWGDLTAQVRVDSALFGNAPVAAEGDAKLQQLLLNRYGNRLDFEKVSLTYSSLHLDVTLGDTYVTYGRGLVLSL